MFDCYAVFDNILGNLVDYLENVYTARKLSIKNQLSHNICN